MIGIGESERHATRPVALSAVELDVLVEHLDLHPVPLVLTVPSPGRTHTERARIAADAWQALIGRGLAGPTEPDPELAAHLEVLTSPAREVDARLWLGRSVRALAAGTGGQRAVLAVKDGDAITLHPVAAGGLPRQALSVLPEAPAGPGRSVSVPSADLDAAAAEAGDDVHGLTAALQSRGVRRDDAAAVTDMVRGARFQGQFGAAARDHRGNRVRAGHVVGFFDTERGRYLQLRRSTPSGQEWSTLAPVDARRLLAQVEELLTECGSDPPSALRG
ncbi:hypothetical protein GCM10027174_02740 [Salinifilum aidingensis]